MKYSLQTIVVVSCEDMCKGRCGCGGSDVLDWLGDIRTIKARGEGEIKDINNSQPKSKVLNV